MSHKALFPVAASRLLSLALLVTYFGLVPPAASQVATGTVEVITSDEAGVPMAKVRVSVINSDTGFERTFVSGQRGVSIFAGLPPGSYQISGFAVGFAPAVQNIAVRIGHTARLAFTMRIQVSETITVTGEAPLVDVLKTDSSTNVITAQIQNLPVPSREFERLAFIVPGINRERGTFRFIQGSPIIGSAGNASQSTIVVDGVDFTDQYLGLARARFSLDAIREFRVVTARFDPEIGFSQGGALNIVTKSGGNEVHGSVFGFYRAADLRATGALEETNERFTRFQVGFTVGGPIVRDRNRYFVSAEQIGEDSVTPFRPGGAFTDLAADFPQDFDQTLLLGSVDHTFSQSSTGFAKLVYERFQEINFRVGGVADISNGLQLNRENWNLTLGHTKILGDGRRLNEARLQVGQRKFDEPPNSNVREEWFSGGGTLRIGTYILGHMWSNADYMELRDTFRWQPAGRETTHHLKAGGAWMRVKEHNDAPWAPNGLIFYLTDTREIPTLYWYGVGSGDVIKPTDLLSAFINDDWRPLPNLTLSLGIRYDYDTQGNNPDFDDSPLVGPRSTDTNNIQPRFGFSWDMGNNGKNILRGGAGIFTGRYLLVPAVNELQQNGVTGRVIYQRLNGRIIGLPPEYWLDPADPENTGVGLPPDAFLLEDSLEAPEVSQASIGFTRALGRTGLYFDVEALYAKGDKEITNRDTNWGGNANPGRIDPEWSRILRYGNEGRSTYKAIIVGLNGTVGGGHMLTSSLTWANKKNISDDFSPVLPYGWPSDSADMEAEWGRSRGTEDWRFVLSGVFRLPARFTIGTTYIYGSGQPWKRLIGYDYNGDSMNSDRFEGVPRNGEDGPRFSQLNLRLTWALPIGDSGLDFIAEAFNFFNTTNYDVNSIDNIEFFTGPTLANPNIPYTPNPNFEQYRATLDPLEVQLGVRWSF